MPTPDQLRDIPAAAEGDGSSSQANSDGSTTTSWPNGATRVDYADKSVMITFADGAVLNVYPDGSRTLNDSSGNALDPATGQPAGPLPKPPPTGPDRVLRLLEGDERLAGVNEAKELIEAFKDAVSGDVNPAEWFKKVVTMIVQVAKAIETEERGCDYRGWCYAVLYGALDLGAPPEPAFSGSLGGADQDKLDQTAWREGVAAGEKQLAEGKTGVALRNRLLLQVATDGGAAGKTLNALYQAACAATDDDQLAKAYDNLGWPEPTGA